MVTERKLTVLEGRREVCGSVNVSQAGLSKVYVESKLPPQWTKSEVSMTI